MAAAQGELGDAAPTQRHWLRSVVYLVSYSDKHPFSQAKKDGWKEEKKPASCQWTHQQIFWNLLQQVFLFKSEVSLGECQDTRRARARAHTHAEREREWGYPIVKTSPLTISTQSIESNHPTVRSKGQKVPRFRREQLPDVASPKKKTGVSY